MTGKVTIVDVNSKNIEKHPPRCFLNPKNEGYQIKASWLKKRFSEGMRIKLLYVEDKKKLNGFIEYIPGENAWRAVDAPGHLFIHCIWISPNKFKSKGYGSLLVQECIMDAKKAKMNGVAILTSEGPFMAGKDLFLANGFQSVSSEKPSYELMTFTLNKGSAPKFRDWRAQLKRYKGLNIIYSNQCPWVARSLPELEKIAQDKDLELITKELKTPKQAQNAPSIYGVFNLVYNGELLADHYISATRFKNIIKKELKK
jgi:ribosomal protein S18 acetylase RimI-like enzyme